MDEDACLFDEEDMHDSDSSGPAETHKVAEGSKRLKLSDDWKEEERVREQNSSSHNVQVTSHVNDNTGADQPFPCSRGCVREGSVASVTPCCSSTPSVGLEYLNVMRF